MWHIVEEAKSLIIVDMKTDTIMGQKSRTFMTTIDNCLICKKIYNRAGLEELP